VLEGAHDGRVPVLQQVLDQVHCLVGPPPVLVVLQPLVYERHDLVHLLTCQNVTSCTWHLPTRLALSTRPASFRLMSPRTATARSYLLSALISASEKLPLNNQTY
jgi:hypothetical protein